MHLVVARYNEKVRWLEYFHEHTFTIYNKGSDYCGFRSTPLPNIGRESHTFLTYIVNNYDNLPDTVAFLQGSPGEHCEKIIKIMYEADVNTLTPLGDVKVTDLEGCPDACHLDLTRMLDAMEFPYTLGSTFDFCAGAQYIVPKRFITSKSLDWWKKLFDIHNNDRQGPWVIERLWMLIWNYETV